MMREPLQHQGYDPAHFSLLFPIEDRHFWFQARNAIIAATVSRLTMNMQDGFRILEVGCGTGNALRILEQVSARGTVIGMDLYAEGLHYARKRTGVPLIQGDMHMPPFHAQFQLIGLFDVLEHLSDDFKTLCDLHGLLADGGKLLLTVPAHPHLWSPFDEASGHCRRYEREDLFRKLQDAGYHVEQMTYFMAILLPIMWLRRRFTTLAKRRQPEHNISATEAVAGELRMLPVVNEILGSLLALEARLLEHRNSLPCGTSLLAVAVKHLE